MAEAIIMPRQGQSVESCIITKWNKKVGDAVSPGEVLFSYETDKASFEEEAKNAGTLLAIFAEEGDDVPCLDTVAVIGEAGEDISAFSAGSAAQQAAPAAEAPVAAQAAPVAAVASAAPTASAEGKMKISPRARGIADNQKLDLAQAVATGPNGRIIERDILELSKKGAVLDTAAVAATASAMPAPPAAEYEDVKLSNVRKVIAKSMHNSLQSMAQLTHTASFDATEMMAYRKKLKANGEAMGLGNITLNDIIIFAVSRILKNHRELNAHYLDDSMRLFTHVHMGMAVDTPRGLLVPTIFNADMMSLNQISAAAKEMAAKAQDGSISPDYLTGGTFTISNLGSFGIESFTPVINPPQTGILGVNTLQPRIKIVDGQAVPYQAMTLSLTYDHRALDGAPASRFLQELCKALENFSLLMAR